MLTIELNEPQVSRLWLTTVEQFHYPHDKPATTGWHDNGQKHYEQYYLNDKLHHPHDKPAITHWHSNGQKYHEGYYLSDQLHRENDKPAYTRWYDNGQKAYETYYLNGIHTPQRKQHVDHRIKQNQSNQKMANHHKTIPLPSR